MDSNRVSEMGEDDYDVDANVNQRKEEEAPMMMSLWPPIYVLMKLLFFVCMVLQVCIWPCATTIIVLTILILEMILRFCFIERGQVYNSLFSYGVFFLRGKKPKAGLYIYSAALMAYTLSFFILYSSQQLRDMPYMTTWIHPDYLNNYSFTETKNNEFIGLKVRDEASKFMWDNTFTWPRDLNSKGLRINGTLNHAGPKDTPLLCSGPSKFECYAANLVMQPKSPLSPLHTITPMPSQFYTTDIKVTPPSNIACQNLEVYRIVYDTNHKLDFGLDYPAATTKGGTQSAPKCNLFETSEWCLATSHSFTHDEYLKTIKSKCKDGDESLVFRIPPRSIDIDPDTARMGLDAFVITAGASVSFRYKWHDHTKDTMLLDNWRHWVDSKNDNFQTWRDSTDAGPVFLRYAIAITPFLMLWFYLAKHFQDIVNNSNSRQVLQLSIFVLLPASLLFFTVGAWIPLAGCITCALAINSSIDSIPTVRIVLLFITLGCNLAQFVFAMVVVGIAGNMNAFMFEDSLRQVQEQLGGVAFVSGSPTWIVLIMPAAIAVNLGFTLGALTCIIYEIIGLCPISKK